MTFLIIPHDGEIPLSLNFSWLHVKLCRVQSSRESASDKPGFNFLLNLSFLPTLIYSDSTLLGATPGAQYWENTVDWMNNLLTASFSFSGLLILSHFFELCFRAFDSASNFSSLQKSYLLLWPEALSLCQSFSNLHL